MAHESEAFGSQTSALDAELAVAQLVWTARERRDEARQETTRVRRTIAQFLTSARVVERSETDSRVLLDVSMADLDQLCAARDDRS